MIDAIASLGIRVVGPDQQIARDAARHRGLGISFADGFALAIAQASTATVASYDKRVRRAMPLAGLRLCPALPRP
jgi:predicted nucleic acid-binding protein